MPALHSYDYAIVRVVPRPEREEFINAGVILSCAAQTFLEARIELDAQRLRALCPAVDLELVASHLATIDRICRGGPGSGPIGRLGQRERFHWLTAARSAVIQTSPVHSGRCTQPEQALDHLIATMVRLPPGESAG